ncbi:MAG: hypothetical protein OEY23_15270 [Acidimicrobiia bacterium]|nr:hypothetical protein [Acidimicrobiia bacterium]
MLLFAPTLKEWNGDGLLMGIFSIGEAAIHGRDVIPMSAFYGGMVGLFIGAIMGAAYQLSERDRRVTTIVGLIALLAAVVVFLPGEVLNDTRNIFVDGSDQNHQLFYAKFLPLVLGAGLVLRHGRAIQKR